MTKDKHMTIMGDLYTLANGKTVTDMDKEKSAMTGE
jgi:hypothetical protein